MTMKTTIQIKSILGKLIFEFEKEDNSVKRTLIEAVKSGADLTGAYLTGADLTGADLTGADLTGADLRGADLTGADLTGADLGGANLTGAYLRGADLTGIYLGGLKIKKAIVFSGLYKYVVIPFISEDDEKYIKMGCFTRKLSEWESDFWNNNNEFPNDGSEKSNLRLFAFETAKKWFELI
jgi:uncharacterized protein YjbI with pentapeptide repeats